MVDFPNLPESMWIWWVHLRWDEMATHSLGLNFKHVKRSDATLNNRWLLRLALTLGQSLSYSRLSDQPRVHPVDSAWKAARILLDWLLVMNNQHNKLAIIRKYIGTCHLFPSITSNIAQGSSTFLRTRHVAIDNVWTCVNWRMIVTSFDLYEWSFLRISMDYLTAQDSPFARINWLKRELVPYDRDR